MPKPNCDCWGCTIAAIIAEAEKTTDLATIAEVVAAGLSRVACRLPPDVWASLLTRLALDAMVLRAVGEAIQPAAEGQPSVNDKPMGHA